MKYQSHPIFPEVIIFTPNVYFDERGYFLESFNQNIKDILKVDFPQDNHSKSHRYVFRGLHYHYNKPMGKLLRVVSGNGIGVILDIRKNSPTYSKYALIGLNDTDNNILWTPPGFAQGFLSLENNTHLCYKCTTVRNAQYEGTIHVFDPELKIDLGLNRNSIILSDKDKNADSFETYNNNPKFI